MNPINNDHWAAKGCPAVGEEGAENKLPGQRIERERQDVGRRPPHDQEDAPDHAQRGDDDEGALRLRRQAVCQATGREDAHWQEAQRQRDAKQIHE